MRFFLKSAMFLVLIFSFQILHAQDSLAPVKFRRNALKVGTSLTVSKYFLSYEHAFTKHVSLGGMASYALGNFSGFTCTIFARYYFKKFNQNSFFLEARGSYSYYNPYVYGYKIFTPDSIFTYPRKGTTTYCDKHRADINYWSAGISGGYKVFCTKRIFFELVVGLHFGRVTFGSNDVYLPMNDIERFMGSNEVQVVFKNAGPDMPIHIISNFGFAF